MQDDKGLTIGDIAARTGLTVSAIRFYEARGLIIAHRSSGNQRRYARSDIRRLSFIKIAQHLGLSLDQVKAELARLPRGRAPTAQDWQGISQAIAAELDAKIAGLVATRDKLSGCIGCGCLSLTQCALYNPQDRAARFGAGPRYLMGDKPPETD